MIISIRWSKTIQFQERILQLPMPRIPGSPLCPLQAVFNAFHLTPQAAPLGPAFVCVTPKGIQPLTKQLFLSVMHKALDNAGLSSGAYSGHSFRRGGATWAHQCGVPMDTIRQIGDWRSNAYARYIFESPESLLQSMSLMCEKLPTDPYVTPT